MRWAGHVALWGEERCIQGFMGKPEGQKPLGRIRRKWEDNVEMDLQQVRCEGLDRIELAQNRGRWRPIVNAVMNIRVP
jgi:hypothetical protein